MSMTPKPRKSPPATSVRYTFPDGVNMSLPTAEVQLSEIEVLTELRVRTQIRLAEFRTRLREEPALQSEVNELEQTLSELRLSRAQVLERLQRLIDHAMRDAKTSDKSASRQHQQGEQTRDNFQQALVAVKASGQTPTADAVLAKWPNASPISLRRVQQLLQEEESGNA